MILSALVAYSYREYIESPADYAFSFICPLAALLTGGLLGLMLRQKFAARFASSFWGLIAVLASFGVQFGISRLLETSGAGKLMQYFGSVSAMCFVAVPLALLVNDQAQPQRSPGTARI